MPQLCSPQRTMRATHSCAAWRSAAATVTAAPHSAHGNIRWRQACFRWACNGADGETSSASRAATQEGGCWQLRCNFHSEHLSSLLPETCTTLAQLGNLALGCCHSAACNVDRFCARARSPCAESKLSIVRHVVPGNRQQKRAFVARKHYLKMFASASDSQASCSCL